MIENRHVPFLEEEIPEAGLKMGLTANQVCYWLLTYDGELKYHLGGGFLSRLT